MIAALKAQTAQHPWLIAMVVSLATFMEVLDTTITNVSLTHIAGSLSASPEEGTWVLTSYLVANGIVLPLSGWLAEVIGRKRYFMMSVMGFTLASLACGTATSLGSLIFFRVLQGLFGGGLQPMQQSIMVDTFPPEQRGAAFALMGVTLIAAPVIGPTLGGWITDTFSWHWIFLINIPVGIVAFMLLGALLEDPPHAKAKGFKSIDYISLSLVALGLGSLQIVLDKGQQDDWFDSNFITTLVIVSAAAIGTAIYRLLNNKENPIIDLTLFRDRSFALPCILIFLTGFALYGSTTILPLMLQSQFGYNATLSGLVLSPSGLLMMFLMPITGKLISKVPARRLIAIGMMLTAIGMWGTSHFTPQTDYMTFMWMRVLQVLGLPFLFIPNTTLAFMNIPKEKSSKASALFSLMRNLGGSVGIALIATYIARRSQVHQSVLASNLVPGDAVYEGRLAGMRETIVNHGFTAFEAGQQAMGKMYQELLHQASILAYHDAFLLTASIMACALMFTLLLPHNNPRRAASPMGGH